MTQTKFYPCIEDPLTGRISKRLTREPMTFEEATDFLKRTQPTKWRRCEAIPQPETHPYFQGNYWHNQRSERDATG